MFIKLKYNKITVEYFVILNPRIVQFFFNLKNLKKKFIKIKFKFNNFYKNLKN